MSEQPNDLAVEPVGQPAADLPQIHHEHVRTDGETAVDDALGAADDPE
ncbi:MAG: hypothetical protein ACRDP9_20665 [Kribbellaceae bacterium]|jgi:hypothetical protein|nr:hypothetical protein [Kribbellaceae bacterium]